MKTLSDSGAISVDFVARDTTISALASVIRPSFLSETVRSFPLELQTFRVEALLVAFKEETDRDIHMVLADPEDTSVTIIGEIPSTYCAGACASSYADRFQRARETLAAAYGNASERFRTIKPPRRLAVTGVGFFDFKHGQRGMAPNGLELHPVLSIEFRDQ